MKRMIAVILAVLTLMTVVLVPVVNASADDQWAASDDDSAFESFIKWNSRGLMKAAEVTVDLGSRVIDGLEYAGEIVSDAASYVGDKIADGASYVWNGICDLWDSWF